MSNTTGGGPASGAGRGRRPRSALRARQPARPPSGGPARPASAERRPASGCSSCFPRCLPRSVRWSFASAPGRSERRLLGLLLLLALLLLRRLGCALLGGGRTARRHQIGRHRGAHLRTGGVVLAQEARDLPALREPLRALVASRTGRGEDPGRVPRIGELRLRSQASRRHPDRQGRRADRERCAGSPPPQTSASTPAAAATSPSTLSSAFAGRREPKLQPCPAPLPHCR